MKKTLSYLLLSLAVNASFAATAPIERGDSASPAAPSTAACSQHYDIVIGVSDKDKVEAALSNAQNLQREFGAACANIEIVNFSAAVTLLGPMSPKATLIKEALQNGVKLVACQNSMNKFKMTEDDLFPGITTVPSGVAEIVRRQKEGWVYLRP